MPTDAAPPPLDQAIDVHAHFVTPRLRAAYEASGHSRPDGMPAVPDWTPSGALAVMDELGVAAAVLSVSSPGVHLGTLAETRELARHVNEEGAAIVGAHPDRFGLFASLPLPDVEAAIEEAEHALGVLGADGISLLTHQAGVYLGDPALEPLMTCLDRHRAVVHVHPTSPDCWETVSLGRPRPMVEFLFDTTRAVSSLALNGVLDRYPGIRFIIPHAGAALPVLADRIACFALTEGPDPVDVLAALRRQFYDVAGFALPRALPALLTLVDPAQLLYGSDHPFTADWIAKALAADLAATDALTEPQRLGLYFGNALGLFPRLTGTGRSPDRGVRAPGWEGRGQGAG